VYGDALGVEWGPRDEAGESLDVGAKGVAEDKVVVVGGESLRLVGGWKSWARAGSVFFFPALDQLSTYAEHQLNEHSNPQSTKHVKIFTFLKNTRFYVNYAHVLYMYAKHKLNVC